MPVWAIKLASILLLSSALFFSGLIKGRAQIQAKWDAERAAQQVADLKEANRQAAVTIESVTRYVDRVQVVKGKTEIIIKEVPKYVTVKADADCIINAGFVMLHNAAAANTLPSPVGTADAAPSGIALSTVAGTVAENYGACHENAEQLMALQGWVNFISQHRDASYGSSIVQR